MYARLGGGREGGISGHFRAPSGQSEQGEVRRGQNCDLVFYSKEHRLCPLGSEEPLKNLSRITS